MNLDELRSKTNIQMPNVSPAKPRLKDCVCETCAKEDVCGIKEELMNACKDILIIQERTNVFIETALKCKKYLYKTQVCNTR